MGWFRGAAKGTHWLVIATWPFDYIHQNMIDYLNRIVQPAIGSKLPIISLRCCLEISDKCYGQHMSFSRISTYPANVKAYRISEKQLSKWHGTIYFPRNFCTSLDKKLSLYYRASFWCRYNFISAKFTGLCKFSFAGVMDSHLSFFLIGGDAYNLNQTEPRTDHRETWMIWSMDDHIQSNDIIKRNYPHVTESCKLH